MSPARRLCALLLLGGCLAGLTAAPSSAAAPALDLHLNAPDTVTAGQQARILAVLNNAGDAPFSGEVTFTDTFPAGVAPVDPQVNVPGASCLIAAQVLTCTVPVADILPGGQVYFRMFAPIEVGVSGTLVNSIAVSGGGSAESDAIQHTMTVGSPQAFAFKSFLAAIEDAARSPELRAGSNPATVRTDLIFPAFAKTTLGVFPSSPPAEQFRNVIAHVPAGLIGNPGATPSRCTAAELVVPSPKSLEWHSEIPNCPEDSQVGLVRISESDIAPLFNMVAPEGVAAEFGFQYQSVPVVLDARLRPSDYGVDIVVRNSSSSVPVSGAAVTLWGVPSDSSHDPVRGFCLENLQGNNKEIPGITCPSDAPRKAFLRLPTSCPGAPLRWEAEADSYQHPGGYVSAKATTPAPQRCDLLPFHPSLSITPTTRATSTPTGLDVSLTLPQSSAPDGLATADLKNAEVALPKGITINPSSADGLVACTDSQLRLGLDGAAVCPDASKIGTVSLATPLLEEEVGGSIFVRTQNSGDPASGEMFRIAVELRDDERGIDVKLPGAVRLDPQSGRIATSFDGNPQLPFSRFDLHFKAGPRAPLATPSTCGMQDPAALLAPWSGTDSVSPPPPFVIDQGCGTRGFSPSLEAGSLTPIAGLESPFIVHLERSDSEREFEGLSMELPPGVSAVLKGVPYCSEAALQAAVTNAGAAERTTPSCPTASQVGSVEIGAGVGAMPLHVGGKAYLTGPYKGAPLGLAVVVPAVAGPFDLGTVVVRQALFVDPADAHAWVISDPLPTVLKGVVLHTRSIDVAIDRPNFTLNPTSCDPMSVDATIMGSGGAVARSSERFQVGACKALVFKPKLTLALKGATGRTGHPALRATLRMPTAGANIARASVALPHAEFLDQSHIGTVCTRVQYAANQCPAKSVYGYARAFTPLLGQPLEGPVYLRSSSHKLPDLVAALRGQIDFDLVGRIDTAKGGIRATFEQVPDAPVSKFVLQMKGAKKGLIENSEDLCAATHRATAKFDGQNGKIADFSPQLKVKCGKSRHR